MSVGSGELEPCVVCGRGLKKPCGINTTGDRAIVTYLGAQTTGFRPRVMSRKQRMPVCMFCAVSIASGRPPEGAFNMAVYSILHEIVRADKRLMEAWWEQMQNPAAAPKLMPGSKPDKGLQTPIIIRGQLPRVS